MVDDEVLKYRYYSKNKHLILIYPYMYISAATPDSKPTAHLNNGNIIISPCVAVTIMRRLKGYTYENTG